MNILFVTAEMAPFAKTGGLADVCGSLPAEIARYGHVVKVMMPYYQMVRRQKFTVCVAIDKLTVTLQGKKYAVRILSTMHKGVEVFFVDVPEFFDRTELYGTAQGDYDDNDKRFSLFQKSCFEIARLCNWRPDIIHCHDWQTGLIPVYVKTLLRANPFWERTKTVFTIHNLAYHGLFDPASALPATGLGWDVMTMDKLEFYGKLSFIKGGLVYADKITTVSEQYAKEIQTKEFGCGLEGVLRTRQRDVCGIINGIDIDEWNPAKDPDLTVPFLPDERNKKIANKGILQKENGLDVDPNIPVIGMITRLADQKGLDILAPIMTKLAKMNVQFVLLGTGDARYNTLFAKLGEKYPGVFGMNITFDPRMSKRIYAGSDMFLMPSRFEPCGLGQMIALRYASVPLVRKTGGLADTINEFDPKTEQGNGFTFTDYTSDALLAMIKRAIKVFKDKKAWRRLVENGIQCDFSWRASAKKYCTLYKSLLS